MTTPPKGDQPTATLSAVEGRVAPPPPPPGSLWGARAAAVAFLLLVGLPPLLYAFGVRPVAAENRTVTPPPDAAAVAALDADALVQLTDHLVVALPGRDVAVRVDAWLDLTLFGTSPSEDVLIGSDDWLFLRATLDAKCRDDDAIRGMAAELERAADLVARTGRHLHTAIAPDKATVYPDRLPDVPVASGCGQVFGQQVRRLLEPDPPAGYVPFWAELEELRDRASEPIYFAADTHWRTEASAVMVEALVDAVAGSGAGAEHGALFDSAIPRRREPQPFVADLTLLTGLPRTEVEAALVFDRPGVTWELTRADDLPGVPADVPSIDVSVLSAGGGDVVPGRVTMLHDSFAYMTRPQLAPFFAELVMVRKYRASVPWVGRLLASSEEVVFEVVERDAWGRIVEDHLAASLAAALRDDLPTSRTWLRPDAGGWAALTLGAGDVVVLPDVVAARHDEPFVLQLRGADGAVVELPSQRDSRAGEELVFDTVGLEAPARLPVGAVEVRLLTPDGEAVTDVLSVELVATR